MKHENVGFFYVKQDFRYIVFMWPVITFTFYLWNVKMFHYQIPVKCDSHVCCKLWIDIHQYCVHDSVVQIHVLTLNNVQIYCVMHQDRHNSKHLAVLESAVSDTEGYLWLVYRAGGQLYVHGWDHWISAITNLIHYKNTYN